MIVMFPVTLFPRAFHGRRVEDWTPLPGCRPQQLDAWPGDDVNSVGAAFLES